VQPEHNPEEMTTTLVHVPTEGEAATIVEALKAAGIAATMTGGFTAGFIAEAPGDISINVFENDREKAEKILRAFEKENESIDWNQVDVGEPEDE
jgi:hypothetical protein